MHRFFPTTILLLAILSVAIASPSQHLPRRRHHSRHRDFIKVVGDDSQHTLDKREECEYGAWRCQGLELQRCFDDKWNTMRTCTSDMICSVDPTKTGCIWTWQADGIPSDASTTISAATTQVATIPTPTLDSESTIIASSTQTESSTLLPEQTSTLVPSNPWSTVTPTASPSLIGNALFHWQDATETASDSAAPEASSWTNTWWTPSPTTDAIASTPTGTSTSSRRRKTSTSLPWVASTSEFSTTSTSVSLPSIPTASAAPLTGTGHLTLSAPHYVIYSDAWLTSMPPLSEIEGFNRFLLAFWLSDRGAFDNALFWSSLTSTERQAIKTEYNAAGVAIMVAAFGATDNPTSTGVDPTTCARSLAAFVKANDLDGVDIDYEDSQAFNTGTAEAWLITFQTVLRQELPAPYIISHAPQAPYFTSTGQYSGGGYTKIHQAVGDGIDFYNIQFYNQGDIYTDCPSLIFNSGGYFPSTSVFEINSYSSVPLNKIVIGKPLDVGSASNGYMSAETLNSCVKQATQKGWNGGVMYWEWQKSLASLSMLAVIA